MNPTLIEVLTTDLGLPSEALRPEASLTEAGIDSLGLVELSVALAQRFQVEVSEAALSTTATLQDLNELVAPLLTGAQEAS